MFNLIGILFTRTINFYQESSNQRIFEQLLVSPTIYSPRVRNLVSGTVVAGKRKEGKCFTRNLSPRLLQKHLAVIYRVTRSGQACSNLIRPSHVRYASKKFNPFNRLSEAAVAR